MADPVGRGIPVYRNFVALLEFVDIPQYKSNERGRRFVDVFEQVFYNKDIKLMRRGEHETIGPEPDSRHIAAAGT